MPVSKVQFKCPGCSQILAVDPEDTGKQIHCPGCDQPFDVPAGQPAASELPVSRTGDAPIDSLCDRFESAWRAGQRPAIEEYLDRVPEPARSSLLAELVQVELWWRRDESTPPGQTEYENRFPDCTSTIKEAFHQFDAKTIDQRDKSTEMMEDATLPPDRRSIPSYEQSTLPPDGDTTPKVAAVSVDRGRLFGEYELLDEIARGGMGVVFKARQVRLNRIVALKTILSGQLAGEEEIKRFQTEAEAAANLNHPGIVPIHEIGECDGQHYFSMGFVDGQSLQDKLRDGPLASSEAAELCLRTAEAVAYAHDKGVIHRDLKPANVLLDAHGKPKVTDFGLAKQVEADSNLTRTGLVMGTPSYMPPEQASGKTDEVGPLADVYSLGAILYCLLTGRPPFQAANSLDTLIQVIDAEPIAPRTLNPQIPRDLETICLKCLEKEPSRRYQSAQEFVDELSRYQRGEPIKARPVGSVERTWRWCKRNPVGAGLIATLCLVVVAIGLTGRYRSQANLARLRADRAEDQAKHAGDLEEVARFHGLLNRVRQINTDQPRGWTSDGIRLIGKASLLSPASDHLASLRSEAVKGLAGVELVERATVAENIQAYTLAYSPDGRFLAIAQSKAQGFVVASVLVIDVHTQEIAHQLTMDFSGDATSKLSSALGQLLRSEKPKAVGQDGARSIAFCPGSEMTWLVVGTRGGEIFRWDLRESKPAPERWRAFTESEVNSLAFSTDGKMLYGCGARAQNQNVKCWDVGDAWQQIAGWQCKGVTSDIAIGSAGHVVAATLGGTLLLSHDDVTTFREIGDASSKVAFNPDGSVLAVETAGTIQMLRAGSWELFGELRDPALGKSFSGRPQAMEFSKDGVYLALVSDGDKKLRFWEVPSGRLVASTVSPGQAGRRFAVIRGDGKQVAVTGDRGTCLYEIVRDRGQSFLAGGPDALDQFSSSADFGTIASIRAGSLFTFSVANNASTERSGDGLVHALSLSADGKRLACGRRDATSIIWDLHTNRTIELPPKNVHPIAFTPDGQRVWTVNKVGSANFIRAWDTSSGKSLAEMTDGGATDVMTGSGNVLHMSSTARWVLASLRDGSLWLMDEQNPQAFKHFKLPRSDAVSCVDLAADDLMAAWGTYKGRLHLVHVPTFDAITEFQAHTDELSAVQFVRDAQLLMTASRDKRVRLWSLHEDQCDELVTFSFPGAVINAQLSTDGYKLAVLVERETAIRILDLKSMNTTLEQTSKNLTFFSLGGQSSNHVP